MAAKYSLGVDYGTNSVRALVVDVATGEEIATHVYDFPSGEAAILLDPRDPNRAGQDVAVYFEGSGVAAREAVTRAPQVPGFAPANIVGIGIDTTGSTPIPVA